MRTRRSSALLVFVASALVWMLALTLLWSKLSPWTSYPAAALSHVALEQAAPTWVRKVDQRTGVMQVETAIAMPVPNAGGRRADIVVEVDPGRYAYGLPIFLALLLAARTRGRGWRAAAGYLLLLPAQAFSLTMFVLIQIVVYAQTDARILNVAQWQLEAIVYGYQIGSLVVPTLVPIMLWLWLDRQFFREVVVSGWRREPQPQPQAEPSTQAVLQAGVPVPASVTPQAQKVTVPQRRWAPAAGSAPRASSAKPEVSSSASAGLPPRH